MRFNDLFDYEQANAEVAKIISTSLWDFENRRQCRRLYRPTLIVYLKNGVLAVKTYRNDCRSSRITMMDRIGNEIGHHLADMLNKDHKSILLQSEKPSDKSESLVETAKILTADDLPRRHS